MKFELIPNTRRIRVWPKEEGEGAITLDLDRIISEYFRNREAEISGHSLKELLLACGEFSKRQLLWHRWRVRLFVWILKRLLKAFGWTPTEKPLADGSPGWTSPITQHRTYFLNAVKLLLDQNKADFMEPKDPMFVTAATLEPSEEGTLTKENLEKVAAMLKGGVKE